MSGGNRTWQPDQVTEPGESLLSSCVMRIRGAAKQQVPGFLDALAAQARPVSPQPGEPAVPGEH